MSKNGFKFLEGSSSFADPIVRVKRRRVYAFYNSAFKIGVQYQYSVPYAGIYRGMGIVAANGVSTLPKYCLAISGALFATAIVMNLIRVCLSPIPLNLGVYFTSIAMDVTRACLSPIP